MPAAPKKPCSTPYCPQFKPCPVHAKQEARQRVVNTADERKFYGSHRWTDSSISHRQREPFCRICLAGGRYVLGALSDHIRPIRDGGDRWDDGNLQTLCDSCHNRKRQQERMARPLSSEIENRRFPKDISRSRVPVVMVCGPPGSGKSTYVHEHAAANDMVVCLDAIAQRLSGLPEHHTGVQWLGPALDERNRMLRSLEFESGFQKVWFVISVSSLVERQRWADMLGAAVVLMDTPLDECIRRIHTDPAREGHRERMIEGARQWFAASR